MSRRDFPKVVAANDLIEGVAVWRTPEGGWTRALAEAEVLRDPEAAQKRLRRATAEAHRIVGPYLADISCGSGGPRPAHLREQIRTRGPSNDPHARQAGE